MKRIVVPIRGMHCRSCELLLEENIGKVEHVGSVEVSYRRGEASVSYHGQPPERDQIAQAVRDSGYEIGRAEPLPWLAADSSVYREMIMAGVILTGIYLVFRVLGSFGLNVDTKKVSLAMALVVGLIAGVSTCMALIGGLVLGLSARHAEIHPEATAWQKFRPHLYFNAGRVGGYAFFGGLLGALGSVIKPSDGVTSVITLAVGAVMVAMGLKLTGLSPRLTQGGLTLPTWIGRALGLSRHNREYSRFSSAMTGAFTFFLPCGFTQAMQLFAVSTGSYTRGALTMALFALGTAPALLGIGGLTSVVKGPAARRFNAVVGLAVLIFGILNFGNGLALAGFDPSANRPKKSAVTATEQSGVQVVEMTQKASGYSPDSFIVKQGVPVKWIITSETEFSCASSIIVPSLKISKRLVKGENVIEFTPTEIGTVPFSCGMGMYRGAFNVIAADGGSASAPTAQVSAPPTAVSAGSCGSGGGGCGCGGGRPKPKVSGGVANAVGTQKVSSRDNYGLEPNEFTVKVGQPVEWTITPDAPPAGCMTWFANDDLGIDVQENYPEPTVIKFTPTKTGDYDVTCLMGMWRTTIHVI